MSLYRVKFKIIKEYLINLRLAYINIRFDNLLIFYYSQLQRIITNNRRLYSEIDIKERRLIIKNLLL